MLLSLVGATLASLFLLQAGVAAPDGVTAGKPDCPSLVFLLKDVAGELLVEALPLADGQEIELRCGGDSEVIDVILPVGPGGSGSVLRGAEPRALRLRRDGDAIAFETELGDGRVFGHPGQQLSALAGYDIHISVTGGDDRRRAFRIIGNRRAMIDDIAPTVNLFANAVKLAPGDFALFTDTRVDAGRAPLTGSAPLAIDRWMFVEVSLGDGGRGWFVVDTGAGSTIIARDFLPADTRIDDAGMVQFSSAGREVLRYAPEGATGGVTSVLGQARVDLSLGTLELRDFGVDVIERLPDSFGRPVVGILGLDAMMFAERLRLTFGESARIEWLAAAPSATAATDGCVLPFSIVRSHLVVVLPVADAATHLIVDTGAPDSVLDATTADQAGLSFTATERRAGGLDGGSVYMRGATASVAVGDAMHDAVAFLVADLPIFRTLRGDGRRVGLLGGSLVRQYAAIEVDFVRRELRLTGRL